MDFIRVALITSRGIILVDNINIGNLAKIGNSCSVPDVLRTAGFDHQHGSTGGEPILGGEPFSAGVVQRAGAGNHIAE